MEENLRRQIAATDKAIDTLVYELYGLTPEEIALVESATAPQSANEPAETPAAPAAPAPALYNDQAYADAAHAYFVKEDPRAQ